MPCPLNPEAGAGTSVVCHCHPVRCPARFDCASMAQAGGERLQRGSVRLQTELGSGCLPELTRWRPMKSGCWLQERRQQANQSKSGSMTDRASREAQKCLKQSQVWGEEQRRRRRLWRGGSAEDFKRRTTAVRTIALHTMPAAPRLATPRLQHHSFTAARPPQAL